VGELDAQLPVPVAQREREPSAKRRAIAA
jgi:hypothetical protein